MRSRSIEMRPKSIATVLVVLPGTCRLSSTPTPAEVMIASVVSGVISETDPTSVVLPTPKPPAITIFADVTRPDGVRAMSEPPKSTQHPFQQFRSDRVIAVAVERSWLVDGDEPVGRHVGDDHSGDTERQLHTGRYFRERLEPPVTQRRDVLMFPYVCRARPEVVVAAPHRGLHQRFDRDVQSGTGPSPR